MKHLPCGNVGGISMGSAVCSFERRPKRLLSISACQDHVTSATSKKSGRKLTEAVKEKLRLGAKILQAGGVAMLFKKNFRVTESERLLKASHCYLSTTAGPIAGILFISSEKIVFLSDKSIQVHSPSGKLLKVHYKVLIPITKIKRATGSENVKKPSEKYLQLVTQDKFEFWFMGFFNRQRILNIVNVAISQAQ